MADLYTYALTSLSDVKETLGITSSTNDNLLKRKINQATDIIEGYCALAYGHHFKETTYTNEEYDGSGSNILSLKMRPVTAITSLQRRQTTQNEADWDDIDADMYFTDLNAGVIEYLSNQGLAWNGYRVTYTAGYATIPADLAETCVTIAAYLYQNGTTGTSVKKKKEGQRELEYFEVAAASGGSLVDSLGLAGSLSRYRNYILLEDK